MNQKLATAFSGGFGGVFPSLFVLASVFTGTPELVSGGPWVLTYLLGLSLWALLGGSIALVFKEVNLKKAFFLGLGLPSLLQAHNNAVEKPPFQQKTGSAVRVSSSIFASPAHAQEPPVPQTDVNEKILHLHFPQRGTNDRVVFFSENNAKLEIPLPTSESSSEFSVKVPPFASSFVVRSGDTYSNPLNLGQLTGREPHVRVDIQDKPWNGFWFALGFTSVPLVDIKIQPVRTDRKTIELTIEGQPGEEFQIWYRGGRGDTKNADLAPIVYTGKLGQDGRLTISVPRAYLLLGRPVRRGGIPLALHRESGSTKTARLPQDPM